MQNRISAKWLGCLLYKTSLPYSSSFLTQLHRGPDQWANEFAAERETNGALDDQWVNEFSKLHVNDWADEFGQQLAEGSLGDNTADGWANAYNE